MKQKLCLKCGQTIFQINQGYSLNDGIIIVDTTPDGWFHTKFGKCTKIPTKQKRKNK